MKNALHFGAGNIGRGFLGQLYAESGWHTTFVDVDRALVEALNREGQYPLTLVSEAAETRMIGPISALHTSDEAAIIDALAKADLASTAVGANILPRLAPSLARGIQARATISGKPLDIILCENLLGAAAILREAILSELPESHHTFLRDHVGLVEASVGRMVPVQETNPESPLEVRVEPYCTLPVDGDAFRGPHPDIVHLELKSNFRAYVARKLYIHNMSHAAAAFLGAELGLDYVWEALEHREIRAVVLQAIGESATALSRKFEVSLEEVLEHGEDLLFRYTNQALGDQVARVARDPLRKLAAGDRFMGALALCEEMHVESPAIVLATTAALRYRNDSDPEACQLRDRIAQDGIETFLSSHCNLTPGTFAYAALCAQFS